MQWKQCVSYKHLLSIDSVSDSLDVEYSTKEGPKLVCLQTDNHSQEKQKLGLVQAGSVVQTLVQPCPKA